ncbi:MAG: imidazoleglycerol-phosphate dehydratase HisB [Elusimicrobiota bacterium]
MRESRKERKTSETDISVELHIEGEGNYGIDVPGGMFKHMLELLAKHSGIDMQIKASGDTEVDLHHTVEDTGIVLGKAFDEALGDRKGIERYGYSMMPMDETRCDVCVDLGGRANLVYNVDYPYLPDSVESFDYGLLKEFLKAFADNSRSTIHINRVYSAESAHHLAEAVFKGLARALRQAVRVTSGEMPSTKGLI